MITLHTFGPAFGLPDPSPFVTKAEVLLKLAGQPYRCQLADVRKAPKGKLPYITDDGQTVADSTLIRFHLEDKYGIDFDKALSPEQKGIAWSLEKLLEDHLYWIVVRERWMDDTNFNAGPRHFFAKIPLPVRGLVTTLVRRQVRRDLWGQGLGRHDAAEISRITQRGIDACAAILGDKPFVMGASPCGADATLFAFMLGGLRPSLKSDVCSHIERHKNLVAYTDRCAALWYPDMPAAAARVRAA